MGSPKEAGGGAGGGGGGPWRTDDDNKKRLKNIQIIFRTLAIERGMPEEALKYVKGLGLSKKDYNKVISQSVDDRARGDAMAAVTGSGRPMARVKRGGQGSGHGKGSLESPVDTLAEMARLAKNMKVKFDTRKAPPGWGSVENVIGRLR